MSQIRKGHKTVCMVLTSRHKNLDTVRAVWSTSDMKARMWRSLRFMRGAAEQLHWLLWDCPIQKMGSYRVCATGCVAKCCHVPAGLERSQ